MEIKIAIIVVFVLLLAGISFFIAKKIGEHLGKIEVERRREAKAYANLIKSMQKNREDLESIGRSLKGEL